MLSSSELSAFLYQADWYEAHLDYASALEFLTDTLQVHAESPLLWARRAEIYNNLGHGPEARSDLYCALRLSHQLSILEQARLHSRLLMLTWSQAKSFAEVEALLQAFQNLFGKAQEGLSPTTHLPLRVGWLSPDFRLCSAAPLFEQIFLHLPQDSLHHIAYSLWQAPEHDLGRQRFKQLIPQWRDIAHLSVEDALTQFNDDQLDVIVDLAGHTSLSGLGLLSRQTQIRCYSGLTFNGPIGLNHVTRFSDRICSPEAWQNENLAYLPSWIIWPAPTEHIPLPKVSKAVATVLGCAHHPARLSRQTIAVWSRILHQLPHSRLRLKNRVYRHPWVQNYMKRRFAQHQIGAERLEFQGDSPYLEYLKSYGEIDIVLDPFPYHGGLVSCESIWMGRPFVTLSTWMHGGASLLKQIRMPWGIAESPEDYVSITLEIAHSFALRRRASEEFRPRMEASAICDGAGWAQAIAKHLIGGSTL